MRWFAGPLALGVIALPQMATAEPIRIVAFGTSATYGRYLERGQDYPSKLEATLKAKGYDVRVKNAGKIGDFAVNALGRVYSAVPNGTHIAILEFGFNEIKLKQQDPASVRAAIGKIVDRVRPRATQVLLVDYMQLDLSSVARAHGAQPIPWSGLGIRPDPRYVVPNDPLNHLNPAGYDIVVARMLPTVEAAVRQLPR